MIWGEPEYPHPGPWGAEAQRVWGGVEGPGAADPQLSGKLHQLLGCGWTPGAGAFLRWGPGAWDQRPGRGGRGPAGLGNPLCSGHEVLEARTTRRVLPTGHSLYPCVPVEGAAVRSQLFPSPALLPTLHIQVRWDRSGKRNARTREAQRPA